MIARELFDTARLPVNLAKVGVGLGGWALDTVKKSGVLGLAATPLRMIPGNFTGPLVEKVNERLREKGVAQVVPWMPAVRAPDMPFNGRMTSRRTYAFADLPLEDFRRVGKLLGGTINDAVLGVSAGAVRRYLHERHLPVSPPLVVNIPVSIRTGQESAKWANYVFMIFAEFPTHLSDPVARVRAASASVKKARASFDAMPVGLLPEAGSFVHPALLKAPMQVLSTAPDEMQKMHYNLVVSNVRGPSEPMYMDGVRIVGDWPASFLTGGGGLNITLKSYLDRMNFGFMRLPRADRRPEQVRGVHDRVARGDARRSRGARRGAEHAPGPYEAGPAAPPGRRRRSPHGGPGSVGPRGLSTAAHATAYRGGGGRCVSRLTVCRGPATDVRRVALPAHLRAVLRRRAGPRQRDILARSRCPARRRAHPRLPAPRPGRGPAGRGPGRQDGRSGGGALVPHGRRADRRQLRGRCAAYAGRTLRGGRRPRLPGVGGDHTTIGFAVVEAWLGRAGAIWWLGAALAVVLVVVSPGPRAGDSRARSHRSRSSRAAGEQAAPNGARLTVPVRPALACRRCSGTLTSWTLVTARGSKQPRTGSRTPCAATPPSSWQPCCTTSWWPWRRTGGWSASRRMSPDTPPVPSGWSGTSSASVRSQSSARPASRSSWPMSRAGRRAPSSASSCATPARGSTRVRGGCSLLIEQLSG